MTERQTACSRVLCASRQHQGLIHTLDRFLNSTNILIAFIGTGSDIAFSNGTGWAEFTKASGVWRFVHDTSQTGFARYRAFKDGVETITSQDYPEHMPRRSPLVAMEFGRQRSIAANNYFNGRLSQIKTGQERVCQSDSDQTAEAIAPALTPDFRHHLGRH